MHRDAGKQVRDTAKRLGLKQLPELEEEAANGMTAVSHLGFINLAAC
jgi:alanine-glyoxylate transaminase/serine-glyoxylate transaminase/serine-pyruvate transaminase